MSDDPRPKVVVEKAEIQRAIAETVIFLAKKFPAADFIIVAEGSSATGKPDAVVAASDGYCCMRRMARGLNMAASMVRQAADESHVPECFDTPAEEAKPS